MPACLPRGPATIPAAHTNTRPRTSTEVSQFCVRDDAVRLATLIAVSTTTIAAAHSAEEYCPSGTMREK